MKSRLTSLIVVVLFIVVSCKKEKENESGLEISGEYKVYKLIEEDPNDGPLEFPVPTPDGDYSKALVKANKDSSMTVEIIEFNKDNDTLQHVTWTGRAVKIGTGSVRFMDGNDWLGTFVEDSEVEIYLDAKITLYARK